MVDINPLDLLKEEMDSEDIGSRVNAIHRVPIVASLMIPDTIKNTLLPYLESLITKEQDEVIFAIAEQIGVFNTLLGSQQMAVVNILENLCGQDETVVRDMAVKSISNLIGTASDSEINNYVSPMVYTHFQTNQTISAQVIRLGSNETNYLCRISAAHLIPKVYKRTGQVKQALRQVFAGLINEEKSNPMIKRVVASKIAELVFIYEKEHIIGSLVPMLRTLSTDEQDLVRVVALDSLKNLAKVLNREENNAHTLPMIIFASEDKSWRVRLELSKNMPEIASSFGKETTDSTLLQKFTLLLKDPENEVKIEAVKALSAFVKIISQDKTTTLIPLLGQLAKDNSPIVRSQLANVLSNVVGIVPKDVTYQKILPLISDLSKDDNQEVRRSNVKAACKFGEAMGLEAVTTLTPLLRSAIEDPKWRVREECVNSLVSLGLSFKNFDQFMKCIEPLFVFYLKDRAYAVRQLGASQIESLVSAYGTPLAQTFTAKFTEILTKETSHHFKIAAIYSLKSIVLATSGSSSEAVLNLIGKTLSDTVPNVRLACVKSLYEIGRKDGALRDAVKKILSGAMPSETDRDTKNLESEALSSL